MGLGVAGVHAGHFGGKERCLVAAGAGADFDNGVAGVLRVGRQHGQHDLLVEFGQISAQGDEFLLGQGAEIRVGLGVGQEGLVLGDGVRSLGKFGVEAREFGQLLMLAPQIGRAPLVRVKVRRRHERINFSEALGKRDDGGNGH